MKGLPRSLSRGDPTRQEIIKQTFVVRNGALVVAGASGVGFGTLVIGDLPEGNILMLGAVSYLQFDGPISANVDDAWEGQYAIGTVPNANTTLTAGDEDLIQDTDLAAATVEVGVRTRGVHLPADTGEIHDNTDGSLELNLNLLVDDAHIGADDLTFTVNGEFTLLYSVLMDD